MRDIVLWDDYTAKIEAIASVNIRAQVGGYLKSINFKEGENVKKGDLLFVIDPRPYEAALASAEAELAEAKARVELAKTNLERAKELYAADVVAKELLDTRNCEMLSSNAVLASAEAKVRNAKLNLEYTSIRAPMSGKISEALVDIGNLIVADSTLLTRIVDDSSVQAYFELSERDVVAYRDCGLFNKIDIKAGTGPTVSLRLFEHKDKTYNGVLNYYDNEISSESASLTMRADFDNSKRQLSLGMDVKKATKDTMDHVQNALIAITLVLSAFRPHGVCRRKRLVSAHQFARLLYARRPKRRIPSNAHRHVQFVGGRTWNHLGPRLVWAHTEHGC